MAFGAISLITSATAVPCDFPSVKLHAILAHPGANHSIAIFPEISGNIVSEWFGAGCADIACNSTNGDSHGTAVAEIIVDMAPNVNLWLYAIETSVDFANAVDDATANNVDIITASLGFPTQGGNDNSAGWYRDGTSSVAQKVDRQKITEYYSQ